MSVSVILRPEAEADIDTIRTYLDSQRAGFGDRFAARLREVLAAVERMPEMYGVVWQDVRAVRLRKFPHVVYYTAFADRVEVLAVLHGARDPAAWQSRA